MIVRVLTLALFGVLCLGAGFALRGLPQGEIVEQALNDAGEQASTLASGLLRAPSLATDEPDEGARVGETAGSQASAQPQAQTGQDDAPADPAPFAFTRLRVKTDADVPEACLAFNRDLSTDETVKFQDYLRLSPDVTPVLRAEGRLLCIAGLAFGETYQVTMREGLPAADGSALSYEETITVELQDRPAAIAFGSGIILPREGGDGVPVTTVNVETLRFQVVRVGDRILSQIRSGLLDEANLRRWQADQVIEENGSLVWTGTMAVDAQRNASKRTLFPLRDVLPANSTGAYLIYATDDAFEAEGRGRGPSAAQWVLQSDLGLTSFSGPDDLRVFVRSIATAAPLAGIELHLLARNNEILARAKTGRDGGVTFDPGLLRGRQGMTPVMVMAYGKEDFMILDLRRPAFDFSDRGVNGRPARTGTDAFVYLDRGIYRPGETVQVAGLLRDDAANALTDLPVTAIVRRPDGIEYRRLTATVGASGAVHMPVTLSRTAPRGMWSVSLYLDTERAPVGSASFDVQDFVPERLEVSLDSKADFLRPGDAVDVAVTARYLYDAPGKGLDGEATMRIAPDSRPFKDFAEYSFTKVDDRFSPTYDSLDLPITDEDGKTRVQGKIRSLTGVTRPLRADITVAVFEPGGRTTRKQISIPVRPADLMVGIRSSFSGSVVRRDTPASFDIVAVDAAGKRLDAGRMDWNLSREIVQYQWYQVGGEWRYESVVKDRPIDAGSLDVGAEGPTQVKVAGLDYGSYRFEVRDRKTGTTSSVRFWSGWYGGGADGRPDRVTVTADKTDYAPGETARVTIRPPMPGKALVTVAGASIFGTRLIDLGEGDTTIEVPVDAGWQSGAYVIVNAYRPVTGEGSQVPVRAIGLVHLGVDQSPRELDVRVDLPERLAPQSTVSLPVTVTRRRGEAPLKSAHVTLAAVDTGILNLTGFQPPRPEDHYFSKRRLGIDIRDDYGRLIRGTRGAVGAIRSGGDGFGDAGGLQVVPIRTVALFSGIVPLAEDGTAAVTLDIPDFVGELTVMAVAFSAEAVGHGSGKVKVRGDVVGDLVLPRFLAPGDTARASLQVNNVEGPKGAYTATVSGEGAVTLGEERKASMARTLGLESGEDGRDTVAITGGEPGRARVRLDVTGPEDLLIKRSWPIEVRAPRPLSTQVAAGALEPGTALDYAADKLEPYYPSTAGFSVTVSSVPGIDVPGLLAALYRYPYGCLEQTTSRGFPLLYFNDLAEAAGVAPDEDLPARLQDAVDRVLDLQRANGAFGMWTRMGGEANLWLSVFAIDFLTEARSQGLLVPLDALNRGQSWLTDLTQSTYRDASPRAYAFYVLAKANKARLSDLRYFFDTQRVNLKNAISLGFLGAALDAAGDRARGRIAFVEAADQLTKDTGQYKSIAYGSRLRDLTAVTTLAVRSRRLDLLPALFERRETLRRRLRFTTTQEKVWLLLLAHELREARESADVSVSVTGTTAREDGGLVTITPTADELASGIRIENAGASALWYVATARGVPSEPQDPRARGLTLSKTIFTLDGEKVDVNALRQSGRYVIVLQGTMSTFRFREMGLLDLLPAGFEIETVLTRGGARNPQYPWLPDLWRTRMSSARDDRFVAAFDIGDRYRRRPREGEVRPKPRFAMAYVVRAVTPGRFALPGTLVEDMYAPRIMARTGEGMVTILPVGAPAGDPSPMPEEGSKAAVPSDAADPEDDEDEDPDRDDTDGDGSDMGGADAASGDDEANGEETDA